MKDEFLGQLGQLAIQIKQQRETLSAMEKKYDAVAAQAAALQEMESRGFEMRQKTPMEDEGTAVNVN
ncbi:MAG: hypothetical protein RPR40_05740 [Bermanella sp.]|jgi:hypothetical protein